MNLARDMSQKEDLRFLIDYEDDDDDDDQYRQNRRRGSQWEHTRRKYILLAILLCIFGSAGIALSFIIPNHFLMNPGEPEENNFYEEIPTLPGNWNGIPETNYLNDTTQGGPDFTFYKWNSGTFMKSDNGQIVPGQV